MMSMLFRMGVFVGDHLSVGLSLDPILALVGLASRRRKEEHGTWHPSSRADTLSPCTASRHQVGIALTVDDIFHT